jgi:hypothetical protein
MGWSKIEFTGALAEGQADWFRAMFLQIAWGLPDREADHLGLYWGRSTAEEPVFYLSPLAAGALTRAMPNYALTPCERPAPGLFVAFGGYHATDPAWFDLPDDERERDLAEIRLSPQESGVEYEGLLTELGWVDAPADDPRQGDLWSAA